MDIYTIGASQCRETILFEVQSEDWKTIDNLYVLSFARQILKIRYLPVYDVSTGNMILFEL
jgi:hypothetical protein